jgi:hypothetical protein
MKKEKWLPQQKITGSKIGKEVKLKNRRVMLGVYSKGTYAVRFKSLIPDAPKGERVRITSFAITKEGLDTLFALYVSFRGCPLSEKEAGGWQGLPHQRKEKS